MVPVVVRQHEVIDIGRRDADVGQLPAQRVELDLAIAFDHVLVQRPADQSVIEARVIEQHALLMDHQVAGDAHVAVLDLIALQVVVLRASYSTRVPQSTNVEARGPAFPAQYPRRFEPAGFAQGNTQGKKVSGK